MLKDRNLMKEDRWSKALRDELAGLLQRIPFARVEEIREESRLSGDRHLRCDLVARVKLGDASWRIDCELKHEAQPRQIRETLFQLMEILRVAKDSRYGMVLAPFISDASAQACREASIGYLDLAGNALLSFDRVFIETRGSENPFRVKRGLRSLFSPKALRVLRVMLTGRIRPWRVTELATAAGVSWGQVSNFRRRLLDEEWAAEVAGGVEISKPEQVLNAWREQVRREKAQTVDYFTLDRQGEFEAKLAEAGRRLRVNIALTEQAGAARLAPMARYLRSKAYVGNPQAIAKELNLKQVDSGSNVVFVMPEDSGVFYDAREVGGVRVACPVQVYADLTPRAGRQDEAAEALLTQVIRKEWATATS